MSGFIGLSKLRRKVVSGAVTIMALNLSCASVDGRGDVLFDETFNESAIDAASWNTCYYWRESLCTNEWNHELQVYAPESVTVQNGTLLLTAREERRQGHLFDGSERSFGYTSGIVTTAHKFNFQYGYVEVRARPPKGSGLWSALWLMSERKAWPPEIDIMEYIGSQPDRIYSTNHPADGSNAVSAAHIGPDMSNDWHTYAVDWQPNRLTFYFDGRPTSTVTSGVPSEPMYLLANLAVGGDWPGPPASDSVFPASFIIDSIKVWKNKPMADRSVNSGPEASHN